MKADLMILIRLRGKRFWLTCVKVGSRRGGGCLRVFRGPFSIRGCVGAKNAGARKEPLRSFARAVRQAMSQARLS